MSAHSTLTPRDVAYAEMHNTMMSFVSHFREESVSQGRYLSLVCTLNNLKGREMLLCTLIAQIEQKGFYANLIRPTNDSDGVDMLDICFVCTDPTVVVVHVTVTRDTTGLDELIQSLSNGDVTAQEPQAKRHRTGSSGSETKGDEDSADTTSEHDNLKNLNLSKERVWLITNGGSELQRIAYDRACQVLDGLHPMMKHERVGVGTPHYCVINGWDLFDSSNDSNSIFGEESNKIATMRKTYHLLKEQAQRAERLNTDRK